MREALHSWFLGQSRPRVRRTTAPLREEAHGPRDPRIKEMHMNKRHWVVSASIGLVLSVLASPAFAACSNLPGWTALRSALLNSVGNADNGGLGFNMWGTLVANDGTVCAVAFSGFGFNAQ